MSAVGELLIKWNMEPAGGGADEVAGSGLLDFGQSVTTGLTSTGHGDPERGEAFGLVQSTFTGVNATLRSGVPDTPASRDGESVRAPAQARPRSIPSGCKRPSRLGWIRSTHPGRRPGRHCRMEGREEGTMSGDDALSDDLCDKRARAAKHFDQAN
jgi:hypothetical protein